MLKVKIMELSHLWYIRAKAEITVRREEQVRLNLFQRLLHRELKEPDEEERVSGLREQHDRLHVIAKDKHGVRLTVE